MDTSEILHGSLDGELESLSSELSAVLEQVRPMLQEDPVPGVQKILQREPTSATYRLFIDFYSAVLQIARFEREHEIIDQHYSRVTCFERVAPEIFPEYIALLEKLIAVKLIVMQMLITQEDKIFVDFNMIPSLFKESKLPVEALIFLKLLAEGKVEPQNKEGFVLSSDNRSTWKTKWTIQDLEKLLLGVVDAADLMALEKLAQDAGPGYGPVASKLIHGVISKPDFAQKDEWRNFKDRNKQLILDPVIKRLLVFQRIGEEEEVHRPNRVSADTVWFFLQAVQNNIERGSSTDFGYLTKITEHELEDRINEMIVSYYLRKEEFPREMIFEIAQTIVTVQLFLLIVNNPRFIENQWNTQSLTNIIRSVFETIIKFESVVVNNLGSEAQQKFRTAVLEAGAMPIEESIKIFNPDELMHAANFFARLSVLMNNKQPSKEKQQEELRKTIRPFVQDEECFALLLIRSCLWDFYYPIGVEKKEGRQEVAAFCDRLIDVGTLSELRRMWNFLNASNSAGKSLTSRPRLLAKLYRRLAEDPKTAVHHLLVVSFSVRDQGIHPPGASYHMMLLETLCSDMQRRNFPEFFKAVLDEIKLPYYKTFYKACLITAAVLKKTGQFEDVSVQILKTLFSEPADFENSGRIAAFRNILQLFGEERLDDGRKRLLASFAQMMPIEKIPDIPKICRMFGEYQEDVEFWLGEKQRAVREKEERSAQVSEASRGPEFLRQFPEALLTEERNLPALLEHIRQHRSIQFQQEGHRVDLEREGVASVMASVFPTVFVKKQVGRAEHFEAVFWSAEGVALHGELSASGSFFIHLVTPDGERLKTFDRRDFSQKLFDECHFLLLEALRIIYVRQPKQPEDGPPSAPNAASIAPPPSPPSDAAPLGFQVSNTIPQTHERVAAAQMNIDLSRPAQKVRRRRARRERLQIASNLHKTMQVFSRFLGVADDIQDIPAEVKELKLYRLERQGGERIFVEVDPEDAYVKVSHGEMYLTDIFVRTCRAYSQPLPYLRRPPTGFYIDHNGISQPHLCYTVVQERPTALARRKYDQFLAAGGEELDQSSFTGFLTFEVDGEPVNDTSMRIGKRLSDPEFVRGLEDARRREIQQSIQQERRELRHIVFDAPDATGQDAIDYLEAMRTIEETAQGKLQSVGEEFSDLPRRVVAKNTPVINPDLPDGIGIKNTVVLPQGGFSVHQTFNSGKFETLDALLRMSLNNPELHNKS